MAIANIENTAANKTSFKLNFFWVRSMLDERAARRDARKGTKKVASDLDVKTHQATKLMSYGVTRAF